MKKIIYLLALIISISTLISCKKDKDKETIIGTYKIAKYKYINKSDGTTQDEGEWSGNDYTYYIQFTDNKEYSIVYENNNEIDYSNIHDIKIEGNTIKSNGQTHSILYASEYNYQFKDGKVIISYDYNSSTKFEIELHRVDKNIITEVERDQNTPR